MIISDLNYIEVVSQEEVKGAAAFATAHASANAAGKYFASAHTSTGTVAFSFPYLNIAQSGSGSSSVAFG
ncbi:MAG: hypothetical protein KME10_03540 [Plectolyngbya sp. WJT66-NPBG17]|jgi:hypothetical protein|nr:hypothetical protein [Plectolyngbya sp. WJT66-NPBG17]MBW4526170.1 hypothetical protein [Phormidium tanganyikae FI6-MK23]